MACSHKTYSTLLWILLFCCLFNLELAQDSSCVTPNNERGTCISFTRCTAKYKEWMSYPTDKPDELRNYIVKARCRKQDLGFKICCAVSGVVATVKSVAPSNLSKRGFDILNAQSCGSIKGDRIGNGINATLHEYPWMALLTYDSPDNPYKCGGSLITNRYVLSAAHCFVGQPFQLIGVRLGEHVKSTVEDCTTFGRFFRKCNPPVQDIGIAETKPHPLYRREGLLNDILLIKLNRMVQFDVHIKPICLPITETSAKLTLNQRFFIAGWGTIDNHGTTSDILQYGKVFLQDRSSCERLFNRSITSNQICALGEKHQDSCRGDSGGPLFADVLYKDIPLYVLYGIISYGVPGCGSLEETYPGVYSNIIDLLPWITENID